MKKILIINIVCSLFFVVQLWSQVPVLLLKKQEGITKAKAVAGKDFQVKIDGLIDTGKVVVVSLDGDQLPDSNKFVIQLYDASTNQAVKETYGRRYPKSRMTYFITSGKKGEYYLLIKPNLTVAEFDIYIKVVEKLGPFHKLDSKGIPSELYTYFMSNSPENLREEKDCLGENGWYLARSFLQGNANIYWEHCNYLGYDAHFGVLLWNKDSIPITVKLNSTSAKSWTDAGSMEPAMCGVWLDWMKNKLNDNELTYDFRKPFSLPAYDSGNPSASAKWILVHTVETNSPVANTFNGLVNLSLYYPDGAIYSGTNLFCDTYIMKKEGENVVLSQLSKSDIVPEKKALRGSGAGAMVETAIQQVEVTPDSPFCFLLTGHDPPHYQKGENIVTTFFRKDGTSGTLPTAYGYSVVYKLNLNAIESKRQVKARFKFNPKTNPNALMDKWAGMYVIGKRDRDGAIFSKQVLIGQEYVFDENVPLETSVTYYLVISGMSSLPLEVEFYNE